MKSISGWRRSPTVAHDNFVKVCIIQMSLLLKTAFSRPTSGHKFPIKSFVSRAHTITTTQPVPQDTVPHSSARDQYQRVVLCTRTTCARERQWEYLSGKIRSIFLVADSRPSCALTNDHDAGRCRWRIITVVPSESEQIRVCCTVFPKFFYSKPFKNSNIR